MVCVRFVAGQSWALYHFNSMVRCGFWDFLVILYFSRYRKLEKANGCSNLVSVFLIWFGNTANGKVSGHWCSRQFDSRSISNLFSSPILEQYVQTPQCVISIWALTVYEAPTSGVKAEAAL